MKNNKKPALPPAVPAPEAAGRRRRLFWAAGLFLLFAVLYRLSHDRFYYFDGLLQAGMIDNDVFRNPPEIYLEWNHFLWYPTGRIFFLLIKTLGLGREGYETLQLLNTLLGAAGAALLFWILSRKTSNAWAAAWTVLAGLGQVYWYRSAGAENHLAAAVWCFAQIYFLMEYWESPGAKPLLGLTVTGLLAAYYHLGHFAAWAVAGLAVLLRRPKGRTLAHAAGVTALTAAGWLPYATVHKWFEPGGFKKWWLWSTAQAHGYSATASKRGIEWDLWDKGVLSLKTLVKSFLYFDEWTWGTTVRLAALVGLGVFAALWARRRRPADRPAVNDKGSFVYLLPFGAFFLLYSLWMPGNYMYWIVPWASLCLFLGAFTYRFQPPKVPALTWAAIAGMALVLAQNNLAGVILPHKEFTVKNEVEMCRAFGQLMPAESPVIISGKLQVNLKPYIPYFARRNRLAIELFALSGQSQGVDPVDWINGMVGRAVGGGIPVYITQDALDSGSAFKDFGLAPGRVESIWKDYVLILVREFPGPPANKLYLLWTPAISPDGQDLYGLRLKMAGLKDQALAVARLRVLSLPPGRRSAEASRLAGLWDLSRADITR